MKSYLFAALVALGVVALPAGASADPGYTTGDVNLRAGPGTNYPRIAVVRRGSSVEIHGCLRGYSWCDVSVGYERGWISSRYLDRFYDDRQVYVPQPRYYRPPVVTFGFGYWDRHYRDRDFYRYRERWDRDGRRDRDWDRDRDWRRDRDWDRDRDRDWDRDRDRDRDRWERERAERERDRERDRERAQRERERDRERDQARREREREREQAARERDRDRDRGRDRDRDRDRDDNRRGFDNDGGVPCPVGQRCD
ncbi:SH3 domain-containing protein [Chthonobacter rhizosphaerae]|uniref:SH3 domain-containing protein n=1 Tax=Chthonobacter rhizosphaerae TaxID=2735553 RepID=UPI0015EEC0FA|nr:SH3 domain-containing protein [Chthonobacter rhizosphaerae]